MSMKLRFFKDRQKFSAAHFTVFQDGSAERLHGHNYQVEVTFSGDHLELGLLAPFHELKHQINKICQRWDEHILLPEKCPWARYEQREGQLDFYLTTPILKKFYSFPIEDVLLLSCNNISCENLCTLFADALLPNLTQLKHPLHSMEVSIGESLGQTVTVSKSLHH